MRKIIVSIHSTVNDIVSGPKGDEDNFVSWALPGVEDSNATILKFFDTVDTILLGRTTYQGLSQAWPSAKEWANGDKMTLDWAEKMNQTPKLVACHKGGLEQAVWGEFNNASLLEGDVEEKLKELKKKPGKDIITFGSPTLVQSLTNAGLADEYRIVVHPVVMDSGIRLFNNIKARHDLRLKDTQTFKRGAVLLQYEVTKAAIK